MLRALPHSAAIQPLITRNPYCNRQYHPRFLHACLLVLVLVLVLVLSPCSLAATASPGVISLDSYLQQHPEQRRLMQQLHQQVRQPAQPLDGSTDLPAPIHIAMIYPSRQASDYWRRSRVAFQQRMDRLQLPYELRYFESRPGDSKQQRQHLDEALSWQPDYLVTTLNTEAQQHMIDELLARPQAPKIIVQNLTTPLLRWQQHPPFMYIGFNDAQGSTLIADAMLEKADYRGKYLMLYFTPGYISQLRGQPFIEAAGKYPAVTQVNAVYTHGNRRVAYKTTLDTLQRHPDLRMIYACSTDVALGAIAALRDSQRTDVIINGWGGGEHELGELHDKGLDLTLMRINDDNGIALAEAIASDVLTPGRPLPDIYSGEISLLDKTAGIDRRHELRKKSFRLSSPPLQLQESTYLNE